MDSTHYTIDKWVSRNVLELSACGVENGTSRTLEEASTPQITLFKQSADKTLLVKTAALHQ